MSQESDPNTDVERVDLQSLDVANQKRQEGRSPKPHPLSSRAVAWLESDVNAWIGDRPVLDARPANR